MAKGIYQTKVCPTCANLMADVPGRECCGACLAQMNEKEEDHVFQLIQSSTGYLKTDIKITAKSREEALDKLRNMSEDDIADHMTATGAVWTQEPGDATGPIEVYDIENPDQEIRFTPSFYID